MITGVCSMVTRPFSALTAMVEGRDERRGDREERRGGREGKGKGTGKKGRDVLANRLGFLWGKRETASAVFSSSFHLLLGAHNRFCSCLLGFFPPPPPPYYSLFLSLPHSNYIWGIQSACPNDSQSPGVQLVQPGNVPSQSGQARDSSSCSLFDDVNLFLIFAEYLSDKSGETLARGF